MLDIVFLTFSKIWIQNVGDISYGEIKVFFCPFLIRIIDLRVPKQFDEALGISKIYIHCRFLLLELVI
jgi:hypothetical protein